MMLQDLVTQIDPDGRARSQEVLWRAAVHEAGHAAVAILLNLADEISVSLVQRNDAGGYTAIAARSESATREMIGRHIACILAGRAAEDVILGDVSAGAGGSRDSDLARGTRLALKMVTSFGLSERRDLLYLDCAKMNQLLTRLPEVREQTQRILDRGYKRARQLIATHRSQICKLAHALVERRGLSHAEIRALIPKKSSAFTKTRAAAKTRKQ
jgi:cell division protease FtsH